MRIAFIVGKFPSLSETFVLNQIIGLIDLGHEVDIYADEPGDTSKIHADVEKYQLLKHTYYTLPPGDRIWRLLKGIRLLLANGYKYPNVLLPALNFFQYNYGKYGEQGTGMRLLYSSIPLLHQEPYDIIHCHFGPYGLHGALLREIGAIGGKLVTTFYGFDITSFPRQAGANIYQKLFQIGDFYTGITTFMLEKAVALGCPKDKIVVLPIGVDLSKYTFEPRTLSLDEPVKIITVARLVEKKGIEYSIKAVAKVIAQYPNVEYRIVGDGELRQPLEKLIAELNLGNHVKLLGWQTQDEVRQLYADSHIFILSSVTASDGDQEGQGLVLQEAQARGLPVLSTWHNGIPDGVLDGLSGFLVPEKDVDALAEKLTYLIEHPEVWPEMGRAGRNHVENNYDVNKLSHRLVEIYQQLLS